MNDSCDRHYHAAISMAALSLTADKLINSTKGALLWMPDY
jgi:hypothetical protein